MADSYAERLKHAATKSNSILCIGLDPDASVVPAGDVVPFLKGVVEATADLACAYKPNFAFFEQYGVEGWRMLSEVRKAIPPAMPAIADAKRGDVPHTNSAYARAIYDELGFDACTVSPYLGLEALEPFMRRGRGVYVLCRTSNPGAGTLQGLEVGRQPLYRHVASLVSELKVEASLGLVTGATAPEELREIAGAYPDLLLLVPGVGAQGGGMAAAVTASGGTLGRVVINASRQVLYGEGGPNTPDAARAAALALVEEMRGVLPRAV